jgi:cell division septation protein DedD
LDRPGFVLQVGAMAREENADAPAESLRQKKFPVIVSRSGTGRFYRVVVGPYGDVDFTLRVKEQLKKQGFDAFRTPWNPSAQQVAPPY